MEFLLHPLLNGLYPSPQAGEFVAGSVKDLPVVTDAPTNSGNKFGVVTYPLGLQFQAILNIALEHPKFQISRPLQSPRNRQQLLRLKD